MHSFIIFVNASLAFLERRFILGGFNQWMGILTEPMCGYCNSYQNVLNLMELLFLK
jgi:hypothetical protein